MARFLATQFFVGRDLPTRSSHVMPFKSKAQRRKFAELLVKGKIKPKTYEEWNRETGGKELPEHVHHKKKVSKKRRKRR